MNKAVYRVANLEGYFYANENAKKELGPWTHIWRSADSGSMLVEKRRLTRIAKVKKQNNDSR